MKKFLLSLTLLMAAFWGHAQVILNEMWTAPQGTNQFVELYNVGNESVDLSCYRIVSFQVNNGSPQTVTKINIIDFPDGASIASKGYYTLGEASTLLSQTMNYNWNAPTQPTGASFKTYNVTNGSTVSISGGTNASGDFVLESNGNTKLAVFLFDGSATGTDASGNISYINGLVGFGSLTSPAPSPALPGIPSSFNLANFPVQNVSGSTCGAANIDWSKVTTSEYTEAASGNNHGYERLANGLCGTWQKITSGYTPNNRNRLGTNTTSTSGTITATETALCNGVAYSITGYSDAVYPLTLQLYYDDGDGVLEDNEEKEIIASVGTLPASGEFTFTTPLPTGYVPVIAYKTPFGCFARVFKATNTSTLVTNQYNACNQQGAFSITNADELTKLYGFPVNAKFIYEGKQIGSTVEVGGISPTLYYSPTVVDITKLSILFEPNNCFSTSTATIPLTENFITGSIATTQKLVPVAPEGYPVRVSVSATEVITTAVPPPSVFPIEVRLYIDNDPTNETPDTAALLYPNSYLGSVYLNSLNEAQTFNDAKQLFTTADQGKTIYMSYQPSLGCFEVVKSLILPDPTLLPVSYTYFTAARTNSSQVVLEWETAMEENNKGFHVQRNVDGTWKNVAFVFSKAERGNSTSSLKYDYKDANSHKGISQYRILQVDNDGRGKFSEVRSVRGEQMAARLTVFPNPSTTGSFNVLFEDAASMRDVIISDVSGRVVKQYKGVGNGSLTVDNLGAGFYTLQVFNRTTGAMATEKVIIKKR